MTPGDKFERLDRFLVRMGWVPSRRLARELIESGRVSVAGRRLRKGETVGPNDNVEISGIIPPRTIVPNPAFKIEVLFEDASVLVVNKPGLIPCHPLRADERATVMNAIVAAYPETARAGDKPLEGGLIHRLDNGTSGGLIIARNEPAFVALRAAIRSNRIERRYLALATGRMTGSAEIAKPIGHHPQNHRRMIVAEPGTGAVARPAATVIEPIEQLRGFTLLAVTPRTGRRHQIRVHLASATMPLAGDALYGGPPLPELAPGRFWLHLRAIAFDSPAGGRVGVTAPLPADLAAVLDRLGSARANQY